MWQTHQTGSWSHSRCSRRMLQSLLCRSLASNECESVRSISYQPWSGKVYSDRAFSKQLFWRVRGSCVPFSSATLFAVFLLTCPERKKKLVDFGCR